MDKETQQQLNDSLIQAVGAEDGTDIDFIKLLIEQGADVNAYNGKVIEIAYDKNKMHLLDLLIDNGADKTQIDIWEEQSLELDRQDPELGPWIHEQEKIRNAKNSDMTSVKEKLLSTRNNISKPLKYN